MSLERMTVYLKSGNVLVLEGVTDWEVKATNGTFNSISLHQLNDRKRLIASTLDFGSVEAVTVEPITVKEAANVDA